MPDTLLSLQAPTLPAGYCWPSNPADFATLIFQLAKAVWPGTVGGIAIGDTPPADQTIGWIRTDNQGNLVGLYTHGGYAQWVSPHPVPPSSKVRQLYVGSLTDLLTFDEGTNVAVSDTAGPFWEEDTDFQFRFLVGPGTSPTDYGGGAVQIAVGGTGGEERHVLTEGELAAHRHKLFAAVDDVSAALSVNLHAARDALWGGGTNDYTMGGTATDATLAPSGADGSDEAHNTMPPYRGIYVIKRTARIYRVV